MSPLGIPPGSAKSAVKAVRSHLDAAGRQAEFEAAIDALAGMLGSTATRTRYGRRRPAAIPTQTGESASGSSPRLGLDPHHRRRAPVRPRRDDRPHRTPQPAARRPRPPEIHRPALAAPRSRNPRALQRTPATPQRLRRPD